LFFQDPEIVRLAAHYRCLAEAKKAVLRAAKNIQQVGLKSPAAYLNTDRDNPIARLWRDCHTSARATKSSEDVSF
jgi:hypothetical protein